ACLVRTRALTTINYVPNANRPRFLRLSLVRWEQASRQRRCHVASDHATRAGEDIRRDGAPGPVVGGAFVDVSGVVPLPDLRQWRCLLRPRLLRDSPERRRLLRPEQSRAGTLPRTVPFAAFV